MSKSKDKKSTAGEERMSMGRMFHVIGRFLVGHKKLFVLAGIMLVFESATAALAPQLLAYVIDYVDGRLKQISGMAVAPPGTPLGFIGLDPIINPDFDTIAIITIGIIVLTMVNSFGDSMAEIYLAKGGRNLGYNLRVSLYAHLQKLSLAFHDQRRTGDVLTRVTSDVAALEDFIISSLSDFVGSILIIFFFLFFMVLRNWQVAVVAAVIIPIMALLSNYFTLRIKAASKKRRASEGELASAAQEMLTSIRVIQTYGLGSYEQSMFANQSQKAMNAALEAAAYQARFSWFVSVLGAFATAAIIWLTVSLIFKAPVSAAQIGLLAIYTKYISDMFKPTKRIIQEWNTFGKLYASIERIGDLLDLEPSVQDLPGAVEAPRFAGRLEFRDVNFAYPTITREGDDEEYKPRTALKNMNFVIEPGQVVAVVGHTGAGKSTIAQLIPRLYDPISGQVLIDGHDLRDFTLDSLRAQISMVLQESILFSGSVVENLAYGRPDATGAQIIEAAKQANAHEFIDKLPQGYYTMLGERGSNLSGGQRQRIAIARAFIRNTSILIMDEPTTGLDAESTALVLKALRKLMKGKTTIIISHDLNLIRDADKIIVIKAGEIEQMGTHAELMQAGGLYANLYLKQSGQADISPDLARVGRLTGQTDNGGADMPISKILNLTLNQANRVNGRNGYDLLKSEQFLRRLPGLAEALDAEYMKPTLLKALFPARHDLLEVKNFEAGKAIFHPNMTCSLQYAMEVRDTTSGENLHALITGRMFPSLEEGQKYLRDNLNPLAEKVRGRPDVSHFEQLTAIIEPLCLVISVFPVDGDIPTLVEITDPRRMLEIMNQTFPDALSGNFVIQKILFELAKYGRYNRCVLRIRLEGINVEDNSPHSEVIYGKVSTDNQGALTLQVINRLREMLQRPDLPYRFRVPSSYGYLPDKNLLLMEALPGKPIIKQLLRSWTGSESPHADDRLDFEEAIAICARIAVTMHTSGIKLGRRRTLEIEAAEILDEIRLAEMVFPELAEQLQVWLDQTVQYAQTFPGQPLTFSHGDFTYTQFLFEGIDSGLVDFDSVCQAEPALDLGQFMAYQRLSLQRDRDPSIPLQPEQIEHILEHFLSTYIHEAHLEPADEALLRSRVAAYEVLSLIRLAVHSWAKLKGERMIEALELAEERIECLTQVP